MRIIKNRVKQTPYLFWDLDGCNPVPWTVFLLVIFFFTLPGTGWAQTLPPDDGPAPDPVLNPDMRLGSEYSFFPVAGYSSDWGFFGGGLLQRINYGFNVSPFLSNLKTDLIFSTKGNISAQLEYERTRLFGREIRSRVEFIGERRKQANYFGIGNSTEFSDDLFDDGYFFFENRQFFFSYQIRHTVNRFGSSGRADLYGTATFWHVNGITRGETSKYEEDMPAGFGKSLMNTLGGGLIIDTRDNEFSPRRGFRYQAGFDVGGSALGSNFSRTKFYGEMRHFAGITDHIVLAQKIRAERVTGETPFWGLSLIGGEEGLRGYHLNRFRGDSSVLHLIELRAWVFSLFDDQIRLGGQVFWDSGRVFSDFDSNRFFGGWKHSYGVGGVMSLLNPDFIIRGDLGFSDETFRIYMGVGYVF